MGVAIRMKDAGGGMKAKIKLSHGTPRRKRRKLA
jgi:hypothetical protein